VSDDPVEECLDSAAMGPGDDPDGCGDAVSFFDDGFDEQHCFGAW